MTKSISKTAILVSLTLLILPALGISPSQADPRRSRRYVLPPYC